MTGVPFTDGENTAAPLVPPVGKLQDGVRDGPSEETRRYLDGVVRSQRNVSH